jgi:TolB-like protein
VTDVPQEEGSSVLERLRRRKVVQWGVAYAAGAWGLLQGISYVTATFHFPEAFQQGASVLLPLGLPITLTVAWYHGDRGEQRVTRTEFAILTLLFLLGGGMFWRYEHAASPASAVAVAAAGSAAVRPRAVAQDAGPSIAVLPFENRSASGEDAAFFADGIQEDLINTLSRVPGLTVIARTAVLQFRDTKMNLAQIAAGLRVSHLVEAGVQRAGDRVRINVQPVRASDGQTEWSERYDRTLTANNIFDVQAYTALGEYEFHYAWNWPEAEKAMLHAIAIDPNYAVAYARQSGHLAAWGRYDEAMEFAERSAALSADRRTIVGLRLLVEQRRYQEVLALTAGYASPQATDYLEDRAIALLKTGHPEEALRRLERSSGLHPDSLRRLAELGWAYWTGGPGREGTGDHRSFRSSFEERLCVAHIRCQGGRWTRRPRPGFPKAAGSVRAPRWRAALHW